MKKTILILGVLTSMFLLSNCESSDINEELNANEFEEQQTDKEDSVNSGGGGNDRPSNDEN